MPEEEADLWGVVLFIFLILIAGVVVAGDSLDTDREVLLNLKSFLEEKNQVNRGQYTQWGQFSKNPCNWSGIMCSEDGSRVTGVKLIGNNISGLLYNNFSSLTALSYLDLSQNYIGGVINNDLSNCQNLAHLNLSHNMLEGELNLTGLSNLQILDLSLNRFFGGIQYSFPAICNKLVVANISGNNFTGRIDNCFDGCLSLQYLDLSSNLFSGRIWNGFSRLKEFSVSQNFLSGEILGLSFGENCSLQELDLSENNFTNELPKEISNCKNLTVLNVWGNKFNGQIPSEIGLISSLEGLFLGNNSFSQIIPESLLNLSKLAFLDLSRNSFGGDVQKIFGRFTQVKFLVLHGNSYTGGLYSSGILKLQNVVRLDLSYNNFSGSLPVEISQMPSLKYLILAYNQFNGSIPKEYGNFPSIQSLDLSFNSLTGPIPSSFGNLRSLLWLMLANNMLTGEIPKELGNCSSLLWLNLANNNLSGHIPPELTNIGRNPTPTFLSNQQNEGIIAGSGECLAMKRWIPADYPPFSFVYIILTRKSCRSIWDRLLRGIGLFPVCAAGSTISTLEITGYLQLSGNQLSGEVPQDIGKMQNLSLLHLGSNQISGKLPPQIGRLPLVVLNLSKNGFSGEIPNEIGSIKCIQNLDLSYNNFSGSFPAILNDLSGLNQFNISYNPLISGIIPSTGQLATFEKDSYLGNPNLVLPKFISNSTDYPPKNRRIGRKKREHVTWAGLLVVLTLALAFLVCGVLSVIVWILGKSPSDSPGYLLQEIKYRHDLTSSSGSSSPWLSDTVKVIRLDKTAFTHADILKATGNFSESRIIGKGGFGTVYRGVLPDGREVAVKKLQREGIEGEKEFRAEMEVLTGNGFGWPHPNLVTLYGWCLNGSEKILIYEYMKGGSLEDLISDRMKLTWRRRTDIAIDVARALVFLHHECYPAIVHRDVKASNVLLDKDGKARVTDFGLARFVDAGDSHVTTMVAGTVGYVAPEYGQTWQATTKGDVYSFGVLAMELATGRRAVDGGEECLVEWARRVIGNGRNGGLSGRSMIPVIFLGSGLAEGAVEMCELLRIGIRCTAESPQARPNMKEVLAMLIKISGTRGDLIYSPSPPSI
ncbi:probable LRR receptor-like serine/threonine-protein kinase At1g74360 [Ricinus communis]|uniref:non-specific serine/threonine protein kinase n=1 Tax=Ricinus communis TaxID=3988 RepID=B9RLU0_RICCO|nr:probable LRR receptor-like serine/threonine-protein kinase At1g74360 [Ricinus communis]EEF47815.1 Brassinosteroid LRR receptor kinase precursor, putative [Ricinus communis]|eukprot:XP_002514709.1 probable LRR receptor-like serine/threonine-protein kinase At1g74360 [Ricinus communis]